MPLPTPLIKVSATRAYGAEVLLHGANYDEAYEKALEHSRKDHLTLIHAFDDDAVIAGQGTLGLEILEQQPDIEAVVAPIGGGGLIGGIACAVKALKPSVQVFGVQPSKLPSMKVAIENGGPVSLKPAVTIADGIAVRRAGERTFPLVQNMWTTLSPLRRKKSPMQSCCSSSAKKLSPKARGRPRSPRC